MKKLNLIIDIVDNYFAVIDGTVFNKCTTINTGKSSKKTGRAQKRKMI